MSGIPRLPPKYEIGQPNNEIRAITAIQTQRVELSGSDLRHT
jgi:hypothetical protein